MYAICTSKQFICVLRVGNVLMTCERHSCMIYIYGIALHIIALLTCYDDGQTNLQHKGTLDSLTRNIHLIVSFEMQIY